jgi:hypothetical protein
MGLPRHQVIEGIHPSLDTGGDQTGQDTGDRGAVRASVKQTVFSLSNDQFQRSLDGVAVQGRPVDS